ncbi:aldehyde dehydrogenase [Kaustia mangrovi]|uniref:Aldehyde dehydrogenase n=1 Tax=Kaustia mangrovi TaxID=2593653 RepID=A0A7S8HDB5_9HYPH|nr:aldehyde dehydrogenase family protein [Kaustia mangrovi]QPC44460.1 aldehyde dehydrogenase [Kaustia mangrovi]
MAAFDPFGAQIFRGNDFVPAEGAGTRDIVDPATLRPVGRIAMAGVATVEEVAREARAAQRDWAKTDTKTRAGALHHLASLIEDGGFEDVAELMTLEMGKPFPEAMGELYNVAGAYRYFAEMARDEAGHIAGTTQAGSFQFARYEPYGVSVHIMPFNFPVLLMSWTVAASLAAGNACIVKPAEATSLSTLKFMERIAQTLPPGLVSCVTGGAEAAQALIASENTHVVAFTGSVAAGRKVAVACAERFKPAIIEAGGNDPMVISDKAPLDVAVAGSVTAAFHLSGQICTSSERFFVHEAIHDAFVSRFAEAARRLRVGPGLEKSEIGPLVSEDARAKVIRLVEGARKAGATVVCGGRVPPERNTGWFYEPTILTGVTPDMAIMREEIFGPVAAVCKVAGFADGVRLANDSPYGLGASVFTADLGEAMEAAETLQAGMVWVNNPLIDNDALPFGGWKMSGMGRELGRQGLDAFRQSKMVVIDHTPKIHDWWYPYSDDVFYRPS